MHVAGAAPAPITTESPAKVIRDGSPDISEQSDDGMCGDGGRTLSFNIC